ncbi:MOSC domain-containing protein YiiM [Paenibacillus cellulosilyticus]|uniref:MOSC domain-containing protein YiiM n=1 Tax=Paenibacillus cellulosilyticus TaxID=375489 RepID=A0A2V2YSW6_9BACL|nr:MOSC domain-containing protein [Paenibacillus cellulosilyticus]PWW00731.1 MOSC domain-containing protein YiiM [Paenibacillus cellulosilyticus]QKS45587.1 MOSC domain-containing protein [Paenibacillus cellulosilyticus]
MNRGNTIVASINVGMPDVLKHGNKEVQSGIRKEPVTGNIPLTASGLPGDGQADLKNHGGSDKAVCAYSADHFPYWEQRLGFAVTAGAFGENFTLSGWSESEWCIGDQVRVGSALLQVTQPRQPCYKLGARHETPELAAWVTETGYTGFYMRVLEDGEAASGDEAIIVERDQAGITIAEANRVMHHDKTDAVGIRRLLAVPALSDSWRETLTERLNRI